MNEGEFDGLEIFLWEFPEGKLHWFCPWMGWEMLPIPSLSTGKASNNRDLIPEKGGKRSKDPKESGIPQVCLGEKSRECWHLSEAKHCLIPVFPLEVAFLWNFKPYTQPKRLEMRDGGIGVSLPF